MYGLGVCPTFRPRRRSSCARGRTAWRWGWVWAAVSAVALVDDVPSIDCIELQKGERGLSVALFRVFSWARINCTATMWLYEQPCR